MSVFRNDSARATRRGGAIVAVALALALATPADAETCSGSLAIGPSYGGGEVAAGDLIDVSVCVTNTSETLPVDGVGFVDGRLAQSGSASLQVACETDACNASIPDVYEFVACADTPSIDCEPAADFATSQAITLTFLADIPLAANGVACLEPAATLRVINPTMDPLHMRAATDDFVTDDAACDPQEMGTASGTTTIAFTPPLEALVTLDGVCIEGDPDRYRIDVRNLGPGPVTECLATIDIDGVNALAAPVVLDVCPLPETDCVVSFEVPLPDVATSQAVAGGIACSGFGIVAAVDVDECEGERPPPVVCGPEDVCECPMVMGD